MLFDVPVVGPQTIAVMRETGTTALAIDAGRTLLLDRVEMLRAADAGGISIVAHMNLGTVHSVPRHQSQCRREDFRGLSVLSLVHVLGFFGGEGQVDQQGKDAGYGDHAYHRHGGAVIQIADERSA